MTGNDWILWDCKHCDWNDLKGKISSHVSLLLPFENNSVWQNLKAWFHGQNDGLRRANETSMIFSKIKRLSHGLGSPSSFKGQVKMLLALLKTIVEFEKDPTKRRKIYWRVTG